MDYVVVLLFAIGFVSAGIANALFFWMQAKLLEEGIPAKQFLFVTDIYRLVKNYRGMARSKGLSSLPVTFFLLATFLTFVSLLAFAIRLQVVDGR